MRPETRQALEQARAQGDEDRVTLIAAYIAVGWDDYWPWPNRPRWLWDRYETWDKHRAWLLEYAALMSE